MTTMTRAYIQGSIEKILPKVKEKYPKWHTEFSGKFELFKSKLQIARITPEGVIGVNVCFLAAEVTEYEPKLIKSICHEFAHLIVGLSRNHDKHFRFVERDLCGLFGVEPIGLNSEQMKSMGVDFKYTIYSHYQYLNGDPLVETHHFSRMTQKQKTMLEHPEKVTAKDRTGRRLKLVKSDLVQNY